MSRTKTPSEIRRLLRREAGFGCCACGHPFIEYHHIVEYNQEQHHRPVDMMALCEIHHRQATNGAVDEAQQRAWKARPYNILHGHASGLLVYPSRTLAVHVGTNYLVGGGFKFIVDDAPLLQLRSREGQLLVSVDLRGVSGGSQLLIIDNEWVTGSEHPWDIEYGYNLLRIRSGRGIIDLEVDARQELVAIYGRLRLGDVEFRISPSGLSMNGRTFHVGFQNLALILMRFAVDTRQKVVSFGPEPGFGSAFVVSHADPDQRLRDAMSALRRALSLLSIEPTAPCPCRSGDCWRDCCGAIGA